MNAEGALEIPAEKEAILLSVDSESEKIYAGTYQSYEAGEEEAKSGFHMTLLEKTDTQEQATEELNSLLKVIEIFQEQNNGMQQLKQSAI